MWWMTTRRRAAPRPAAVRCRLDLGAAASGDLHGLGKEASLMVHILHRLVGKHIAGSAGIRSAGPTRLRPRTTDGPRRCAGSGCTRGRFLRRKRFRRAYSAGCCRPAGPWPWVGSNSTFCPSSRERIRCLYRREVREHVGRTSSGEMNLPAFSALNTSQCCRQLLLPQCQGQRIRANPLP